MGANEADVVGHEKAEASSYKTTGGQCDLHSPGQRYTCEGRCPRRLREDRRVCTTQAMASVVARKSQHEASNHTQRGVGASSPLCIVTP